MLEESSLRNVLIALCTGLRANSGDLCRLCGSVEDWIHLVGRRGRASIERSARALRVRPRVLLTALELAIDADRTAEDENARCSDIGAHIVTRTDATYPTALLDLSLPPPLLYVKGDLEPGTAISIVGSRRSDTYGLDVAEAFAFDLAARGIEIVSGLALGIDAAAHRGALRAAGGRTVAVLGCGIDVGYPRRNRRLAEEIGSRGALVTEFPRGAAPAPWRFPVRNRIIAALSLGTVVVRATPKSGSLITANHALELGRNVYAVPGGIFDRLSVGPNSLIRDGAFPAQHPRDIIEALSTEAQLAKVSNSPSRSKPVDLEPPLSAVLDLLLHGRETSEDEILARSPLSTAETISALSQLEIRGLVRKSAGACFSRVPTGLPVEAR